MIDEPEIMPAASEKVMPEESQKKEKQTIKDDPTAS